MTAHVLPRKSLPRRDDRRVHCRHSDPADDDHGRLQAAFAFHAKSQVNHATAAAARAGSFSNASMNSMTAAFARGMVGYYGGGTSLWELTQAQDAPCRSCCRQRAN